MLQLPETKQTRAAAMRGDTKIAAAFRKLEPLHIKMVKAYADRNSEAANRYLGRAIDAAEKIIAMPAAAPGDMLLKIAAAGVLVDNKNSDTAALVDWQADLQGGICDYAAAALLMTLRDDLNRLMEKI